MKRSLKKVSLSENEEISEFDAIPIKKRILKTKKQESCDKEAQLWIDKYNPLSVNELAVHTKKVNSVRDWLKTAFEYPERKILILTGISGCGKSSTIRVLSKELGFEINEWINPIDVNAFKSIGIHQDYTLGMGQQFTEFLIRNCRSGHLTFGETRKKSILLVEDLPNVAHLSTRMIVHSAIRRFWMLNHVFPLVFILSDMGVDGESSLHDEMDVRFLIPSDILPYCATIAFNPIAPTIMKKALKRICEFEFRKVSERPPMAILDQFCMESQGDIRHALSSLQFYCLSKNNGLHGLFSQRDSSTNLFHALGKILYAKRLDEEESAKLPSHLSMHQRNVLEFNPEKIIETTQLSTNHLLLYLHQNYTPFFQEIDDCLSALQYMSDADQLNGHYQFSGYMHPYVQSVAVRGMIFSKPVTKQPGFMMAFHKPTLFDIEKRIRSKRLDIQLGKIPCWNGVNLSSIETKKEPEKLMLDNDPITEF